ncbi:hypothetical protein HDU84_001600 [Entophlyctis sp. JEL0112]|nr:hypothetical protein HDU84_001600 [Entophlyctis sp. JEL0112]
MVSADTSPPCPAMPSPLPRPSSPLLLATSPPATSASPLRPRCSLPPGSLKPSLSPSISSSAPSKPLTSILAFDADTAKSHVNERAARKVGVFGAHQAASRFGLFMWQIMDLEIANESLLAVNTTLENTIREQALNLEQMRRMMGLLKRKYGETSLLLDLDGAADDSASNSGTFVESVSTSSSKSASFVRQKFDPFSNSVIEEIESSPELEKEVEQQFSRVCDTISNLIEAGEKALKTTFKAKPIVPDIKLSPALNTQGESVNILHQVPQTETSSLSIISPPTTILSSSPTKSKPIIARSKLTPMTSDILAMGNTYNNNNDERVVMPPPPVLTPEAIEGMYKKARLLITARRAYTRRQVPCIEQDLAAMDAQISCTETVELPTPLYAAFVEVIDGVHDDLVESRKHQQRLHQQHLYQQQTTQSIGKAIIPGGFAISVGGANSAVVVGSGGAGAAGMRIKQFGAMASPAAVATAALVSSPTGTVNADMLRRRTTPPPMARRVNSARPGSPHQRSSAVSSPGPAHGPRIFPAQRRSVQSQRRDL